MLWEIWPCQWNGGSAFGRLHNHAAHCLTGLTGSKYALFVNNELSSGKFAYFFNPTLAHFSTIFLGCQLTWMVMDVCCENSLDHASTDKVPHNDQPDAPHDFFQRSNKREWEREINVSKILSLKEIFDGTPTLLLLKDVKLELLNY